MHVDGKKSSSVYKCSIKVKMPNTKRCKYQHHPKALIFVLIKLMMKNLFCWLLCCLVSLSVLSQHVRYEFSAPNAIHHEAEITVLADGLTGSSAIFRMSRSSPGRYAKHEFGKNVYNVMAYNAAGKPLKVEKDDADVYRVTGHKGTVRLTYTLYGDYADGTYASIDRSGYHLNMPASFIWVKGLEAAPITIQFAVPVTNWKIATQLKPTSDPLTFTAPNLQYFMDAPTKIGNLHWREWTVINTDNKPYKFRLALEAEGTEALIDTFTEKVKQIVIAAKNVFGELPSYDFGTYTFIASINPFVHGDGMEHRNSTMITLPANFDGSNDLLGVFAHEFFHCWNVERIRPKSLEPFNFEKSNMSEAMWVAEGFTQYYGSLLQVRAGVLSDSDFLSNMSGLINAKNNTPGGQLYTPIENSQRAVFVDAGVSIDRTNYVNMFTSYYSYGGAIALALDLELRSRFNKSQDDVMKELWKKHGKPEIPYTLPDVQNALAAVTNTSYANDFLKKYVYGHELIDYKKLFAAAGYFIVPVNAGKASFGRVSFDSTANVLTISRNTILNTPLYNAGLDIDDIIVELDGRKIKGVTAVDAIICKHKIGDKIAVTYLHHDKPTKTTITLKEDPWIKIEKIAEGITDKQQQLSKQWMKGN
jgi:predicted metalloprotease with PDZ domain